jgi:hypothetical protein
MSCHIHYYYVSPDHDLVRINLDWHSLIFFISVT